MSSITHDSRSAVTSATEAERRVPSDADYEHAFRLIRRVQFTASSPLNCLTVVEAYILSGLGKRVPLLLRAIEECRINAEDAGELVSA